MPLSDAQYIAFLNKAARRLNRVLGLTDTSSEITLDTDGEILTPAGDGDLEDLLVLQTECLIAQRALTEAINEGTDGVYVEDGEQTIDTRQRGTSRVGAFDSNYSSCAELERQLNIEKMKRFGSGDGGRLVY